MLISLAPAETPPEPRGTPKGETDILRAAEGFYAAHNALLMGAGSVAAVADAEDRLNEAIWSHYSPYPEFAERMKP